MGLYNADLKEKTFYTGNHFFMVYITETPIEGKIIILPLNYKASFFDLNDEEKNELELLVNKAKALVEEYVKPISYDVTMNSGNEYLQLTQLFNCQVVPRYRPITIGSVNDVPETQTLNQTYTEILSAAGDKPAKNKK